MNDDWGVDDILDKSTHSSVTRRRLTNTKRGRIGLFQRVGLLRGWLYNKPLIDYLEGGEIVDYLFVSSKPVTEFTAGQKTELVPKKGYSSIVAITDDRILLLIARKPTNDKREIQYRDIENFGSVEILSS